MKTQLFVRQQGASLIVSLIMLLLLTIIGLSAMQSTVMQEKMTSNLRDTHVSFHAAEIALDYSENWIQGLVEKPDAYGFPCSGGVDCDVFDSSSAANTDQMKDKLMSTSSSDFASWKSNASTYGHNALDGGNPRAAQTIAGVARQPYMAVEYSKFDPDSLEAGTAKKMTGDYKYKHTVQTVGASESAETIVQTLYVKRFN